jgi:hypothetical protein
VFHSWDVLKLGLFRVGMFWGLGNFEAWDVLELGCFAVGTVWSLGHFVAGTFGVGTFYRWDLM